MLLERRGRDDVLLARGLLLDAARIAAELGMEGLARQVERLQVGRGGNDVAPTSSTAELRLRATSWRLELHERGG